MVIKPLSAVKSTIEDQPFTLRQKDSPKATQYKTEMNVAELIENGYLKKIDDGDNVKIGHFNEGAETKRNDVKEGCTDRGDKHIDDKPSIIDTLKNKFQKKEAIEGNDQAHEQKIGFGDKLKSLFSKERANDAEEKNVENEKPYKNDREKFMDSFKVDKNGEYVESREKKNDSNTDANPEDNDQMNESRNESSKTNDFRESLKVEVDPYAHLNVKDAPQREPGGRVRGPESNHHLDDDVER